MTDCVPTAQRSGRAYLSLDKFTVEEPVESDQAFRAMELSAESTQSEYLYYEDLSKSIISSVVPLPDVPWRSAGQSISSLTSCIPRAGTAASKRCWPDDTDQEGEWIRPGPMGG